MNQGLELATREIMWNIPASYKFAMYVLLALSMLAMMKGIHQKLIFITGNKGIKAGLAELFPKKLNIKSFFHTALLSGKTPRLKDVAIFHGLIFWGFFILWIATDLVAIHYDTPFKVFKGTTYIVVSFLADIAGIAVLLGLCLAYTRRYINKPPYLSATKPKEELYMYIMLASLVIIGYLTEGVRILGQDMPIGEKSWAPIGYYLATLFQSLNLSDATLSTFYRGLWLFHMINTMVFIAAIGYTKFSHILFLPFQALVTPKTRGAIIEPMDFDIDESVDDEDMCFGLGKLSQLSVKNRLDLATCVECGRCTQACPANAAGKPLDPKLIITKIRDLAYDVIKKGETDASLWEVNPLFVSNELDSCTTCGACMEECPANIEHINIIIEAKRYKTLMLADIPPAAASATNKIKVNGNPWGIAQDDRFNWADGLDIPVIETGKKVDYLYYVGCAGSYDAANQKVVKDTIMLLKKAGVDFAVMGKTEKCNGDPIRRFGDEYTFFEVAIENITNMRKYEFSKVVTHCPHCLHTIGKEYAKFEDGHFDTIHHTELLADLLKSGKLRPNIKVDENLTFHDPCYLGRHHGQYNAPREILKSIEGVKITEMDKNKDNALCCGMGGGNMWYELPEGEHLAKNRLQQIGETNTPKLATACSFCLINFNSTKAQVGKTENIDIEDVASILAKSIE
ncbi:MAG: (Fe-S)-binding protein [Bacteriovoracaceae bacterium]|nr:(Fe-S)-binding protein [Bacteriovoracaceae bacterium]